MTETWDEVNGRFLMRANWCVAHSKLYAIITITYHIRRIRLMTICACATHTLHIRICGSFISSHVIGHWQSKSSVFFFIIPGKMESPRRVAKVESRAADFPRWTTPFSWFDWKGAEKFWAEKSRFNIPRIFENFEISGQILWGATRSNSQIELRKSDFETGNGRVLHVIGKKSLFSID